jgi:hypothetical protein
MIDKIIKQHHSAIILIVPTTINNAQNIRRIVD